MFLCSIVDFILFSGPRNLFRCHDVTKGYQAGVNDLLLPQQRRRGDRVTNTLSAAYTNAPVHLIETRATNHGIGGIHQGKRKEKLPSGGEARMYKRRPPSEVRTRQSPTNPHQGADSTRENQRRNDCMRSSGYNSQLRARTSAKVAKQGSPRLAPNTHRQHQ